MQSRLLRKWFRITVISIAFASYSLAWGAGDYSAWGHSAELVLNTTSGGAGIASTVTGFPLLVRLKRDNFDFSQARPDGGDIRFAKPDGSPLPYEIERWDSQLQAAEVWVKVDTIRGNDAAQTIRMYWGNEAAADSSMGTAVFGAANGYLAAWHLGGKGTAARPNAAGGNPAQPANYDGDEAVAGVIAGADSLDGAAAGDYLDLGDGYEGLAGGMTFSVWAFPTAVKTWSHLLDLGNGEDADNVVVGRWDTTAGYSFLNYSGANRSALQAPGQLVQDQWQLLGVTVSGKSVKLYKNGGQVLSDTLDFPIAALARYLCFMGRSNSARGAYFQGKLDEAEISAAVRGADWMKLSYQNQKPGQSIPAIRKAPACVIRFSVPSDTTAPGGSLMTLRAQADCASSLAWSVLSGPAVRILDPEITELNISLPQVAEDTVLVLRFTAVYGDSTRTGEVNILVQAEQPTPLSLRPSTRGRFGKGAGVFRPAVGADRDALGRAAAAMQRHRTRSRGP
jgi:hypothetical protein